MDQAIAPIVAAAPGGWIWLALCALAPVFAAGSASDVHLAISLGCILFAHRAFSGISSGLSSLARAALAWRRVSVIFEAGAVSAAPGPWLGVNGLQNAECLTPERNPTALIDASQLRFSYSAQGPAVLRGVDLQIKPGERLPLQGASGGGKSTLAAMLVGLRQPTSGLLLLGGLDRHTLGEAWHQGATEAPQFLQNHVLTGSLGLNLLMGRNWPASSADLAEAQALCEELGLGELLARMPAGLMQRVGETGWQLSHGERSRIFLARALLQKAPLTVLDESFAALDPETLRSCLAAAWRHSQAL